MEVMSDEEVLRSQLAQKDQLLQQALSDLGREHFNFQRAQEQCNSLAQRVLDLERSLKEAQGAAVGDEE